MSEFVAQIRGRRDYHHPWQEPIKNCQSYLFYVRRVLKKKGPRKILCKNSIPILTRLIRNKDLHGLILPPLILDRSNNPPRAFRIFFSFLFFSPDFIQGRRLETEEERDVFREEKLVGKEVQPQRRKVKSFPFSFLATITTGDTLNRRSSLGLSLSNKISMLDLKAR